MNSSADFADDVDLTVAGVLGPPSLVEADSPAERNVGGGLPAAPRVGMEPDPYGERA